MVVTVGYAFVITAVVIIVALIAGRILGSISDRLPLAPDEREDRTP